jgi:hypothetical protein
MDKKAFIQQARDRFKLAEDADNAQRTRELADLRFYAGEQWDADILKSRQGTTIGTGSGQQIVPARPSLTINKTREPVRQVLNQERQSDMGIELIPADDFGEMAGPIDHTEIELREGLVRRIQRDSEAADARTWAFSRAAIAGRGYWLVMTRFVPGKTWDQEVYIERIYNQASVLLDPSHEQPDGSDAEWGFYGTDLSWDTYKSEFGKVNGKTNRAASATTDKEWRALGDEAPGWFNTSEGKLRSVRVMNYYYTTRTDRTLALLEDGSIGWLDELQDGIKPKDTRTVTTKQIQWAKIDGVNVLEETDWPGHYLPIIKVVGEELQPYDKERRCEGIVRPMRDPCMGNNYIVSKFVERVGLTPISPWMMASGQDTGYEDEYNYANSRSLSRLHYNQKDDQNAPAPPPFRADARSEIADIGMGVQIFGQAIVSTSVVPETALGNVDPSVKSGKLAKALIEQGERGTSNFLDNLKRSMRHEARIVNDLLYPIYGRAGRLARMMNKQGEMAAVLIGQPFTTQGQGAQAQPQPIPQGQQPPPDAKLYQLTPDAEFNVAIKVSKSEDTRRQQETQILGEMIAAAPELMNVFGDLFFKYQDGPGHEEMAERMKAVLLPQVQQMIQGKQALPPEVEQQMAMMQQQMQELQQLADKNITDLKKAELTQQAENERAQLETASKERLEFRKLEVELEIEMAKLGSAEAMARAQIEQEQLHQHGEASLRREEMASQQAQADMDRQAASQQSAQEHGQALEQGEQGHQQALAQGAQAGVQQMAVNEQQAALQPPETGA